MSRIWAALPTANAEDLPPAPAGVCWWRLLLPIGPQGHHLIIQTYPDHGGDVARLGYWEWFDDLDVNLVYGHDVFDVRFGSIGGVTYLDVLAIPIQLFRGGGWANLAAPDDEDQRYPFQPLGFGFRQTPALPYRYAPRVGGRSPSVTGRLDARRVD